MLKCSIFLPFSLEIKTESNTPTSLRLNGVCQFKASLSCMLESITAENISAYRGSLPSIVTAMIYCAF